MRCSRHFVVQFLAKALTLSFLAEDGSIFSSETYLFEGLS